MRWSVVLLLAACDRLIGIEDPHGVGPGGDGGSLDGSGSGSGSGSDGAMGSCSAAGASFGAAVSNSATGVVGFAVGDLDKNGTRDLAVAVQTDVGVMFDDGTGKFPSGIRKIRPGENVPADDVLIADLDGDGRNDVLSWPSGGAVQINLHDTASTTAFLADSAPNFGIAATQVFVGELNASGTLDLAITDGTSTKIFLGAGGGQYTGPTDTLAAAAVGVADIDGDGADDVIVRLPGQHIGVAFSNGDGTFTVGSIGTGVRASAGKFSTDAHPALIVDRGDGSVGVIRQTAARTFAAEAVVFAHLAFNPGTHAIQIVDANGDGRDDVIGDGELVTQCGPPAPPGGVSQATDHPLGFGIANPAVSALADLDKDGKPDAIQIDVQHSGVFVSLQQ